MQLGVGWGGFAEDKAKFVPAMIGMCVAEDGVALGLPGRSAGQVVGLALIFVRNYLQQIPPFCSGITHLRKCSVISALVLFLRSVLSTSLLTSLFPPSFIVGSFFASDQSFPASMILIIYCRLCRVKSCIPHLGSAFKPVLCIFDKIIF